MLNGCICWNEIIRWKKTPCFQNNHCIASKALSEWSVFLLRCVLEERISSLPQPSSNYHYFVHIGQSFTVTLCFSSCSAGHGVLLKYESIFLLSVSCTSTISNRFVSEAGQLYPVTRTFVRSVQPLCSLQSFNIWLIFELFLAVEYRCPRIVWMIYKILVNQ